MQGDEVRWGSYCEEVAGQEGSVTSLSVLETLDCSAQWRVIRDECIVLNKINLDLKQNHCLAFWNFSELFMSPHFHRLLKYPLLLEHYQKTFFFCDFCSDYSIPNGPDDFPKLQRFCWKEICDFQHYSFMPLQIGCLCMTSFLQEHMELISLSSHMQDSHWNWWSLLPKKEFKPSELKCASSRFGGVMSWTLMTIQ